MKRIVSNFVMVFLLLYICTPIQLFSQKRTYTQAEVDSLKQVASVCDSSGVVTMGNLATHHYIIRDFATQGHYVHQQVLCAEQLWQGSKKYQRNVYRAYYHLLLYNLYRENPITDSLLLAANKMRNFALRDTSFMGRRHEVLASMVTGLHYFDNLDDFDNGFETHMETIDLAMKYKTFETYLWTAYDIFDWYKSEGKLQEAFDLAEDILSKVPNPDDESNKAEFKNTDMRKMRVELFKLKYGKKRIRLKLPNPQDSDYEEVFEMGKKVIQRHIDDDVTSEASKAISFLLEDLENYLPLDTLLIYSTMAVKMEEDFKKKHVYAHYMHGKLLNQSGKYKSAKKYLSLAISSAKEKNYHLENLIKIHNELISVNLKLGHTKAAQENFDLYKVYSDSAYTRRNRTAVETVETKYELKQQIATNEAMAKEAETLSQRAKLFSLIGLLLFILLGLALVFYFQQRKNARQLSHLNETKNKIFAILGHDLKGPSLAFNGLARKLSFLIKKNDPGRLLKLANDYEESGTRLSRIINGVLDWALTENESFLNNPEKIEILPILKQSINDLEWALKEKNISIDVNVPEDGDIIFDKNAFAIINRNLIHNAIKFSPTNSSINIRYHKQNKNLEYIDLGKGMSPDIIQKIFNGIPVESSLGTHNERGTGIGLVTCMKLLKLNKGNLSILQNSPKGTIMQLKFT